MVLKPAASAEIRRISFSLKTHRSNCPDGYGEVLMFSSAWLAPLSRNLILKCFYKLSQMVVLLFVMKNSWPISLLSVISQNFEKAKYSRIVRFLKQTI